MSKYLRNNLLEVEIGEPGVMYSDSRFDHSGNIRQITFNKKHTFCTTEKAEFASVLGFGLLNEFDINGPAGYSEANPGERFLKIGVGSLLKENQVPYNFLNKFKNDPLKFEVVQPSETQLDFKSKSPLVAGIQTLYSKKLSILGNQLIIDYFLKNCGEKSFSTEEYCHNFLAIDRHGVSADYQLKFDFELHPELFSKFLNPEGLMILAPDSVSWKNKPLYDFFIARLNGTQKRKASWTLTNKREKVGVSEQTDFESARINLWGNGHVVSPELFHQINLSPGEETRWQRVYTFFEI
jgi:hypothetical protein